MSNATALMFDTWMSGAKALNWNQDQVEKLTTTWLGQVHTMRHDGEKVLEVMVGQAKNHTEQLQTAAKQMLESVPGWDVLTQQDLRKQVDELNKRVDALSAK